MTITLTFTRTTGVLWWKKTETYTRTYYGNSGGTIWRDTKTHQRPGTFIESRCCDEDARIRYEAGKR